MSGRSLGTAQNSSGEGLSPLEHRMILQALYPNTGVISGLNVTANSGLTYHVDAGVGVTSRGSSDGNRIFYFSGGNSPSVAAGDSTYARIDAVWVKADDPKIDSDSVNVHVGVTQGAASSSPVDPQIPSDATLLRYFRVNPGVTSLNNGSTATSGVSYIIPYGGSRGILHRFIYTTDGAPSNQKTLRTMGSGKINLPTDRLITFNLQVSLSTSGSSTSEGGFWMHFRLDGKALYRGQGAYSNNRWDNLNFRYPVAVEAGTHTVDFQYAKTETSPDFTLHATNLMKPFVFTVEDMGVSE